MMFLFVVGLIVAGIWRRSWWCIGFGVVLGYFWIEALMAYRSIYQRKDNDWETKL